MTPRKKGPISADGDRAWEETDSVNRTRDQALLAFGTELPKKKRPGLR